MLVLRGSTYFRTLPREHWIIWKEYVQGTPKLTIKKLRPAWYRSTYVQFIIKRICIHSWFYYYNFKHGAINLKCIRKVIENNRGLYQ